MSDYYIAISMWLIQSIQWRHSVADEWCGYSLSPARWGPVFLRTYGHRCASHCNDLSQWVAKILGLYCSMHTVRILYPNGVFVCNETQRNVTDKCTQFLPEIFFFSNRGKLNQHWVRTWISNPIYVKQLDVITDPCPNLNGALLKSPLKVRHG